MKRNLLSWRRAAAPSAWVLVAVVALLAPRMLDTFWTSLLIQILVFGLFALSADLLIGHVGLLPMGHAAFFAVGAYATAILEVRHGQGFVLSVLGGAVAATLLAVVVGLAVRTGDVYFILLTLALGNVVWGAAMRWTSFTGGENGVSNVPAPVIAGFRFQRLDDYYYLVLATIVACALGYRKLISSPFGLTLRGIRESESRMRALGYRVGAHKLAAFVLSSSFGGVHAVDGAWRRVPAGQRRAIIGPNGAGKTTFFNCLTGVLRPTSGRILLFGADVTRMPEYRRARLGVGRTYQISNVFLGLTVLENVALAVHGTSRLKWMVHRSVDRLSDTREQALGELDKVGLAHRRDVVVRALSYGERRQLELALAMASRPRVLLLDEPTAGLAPAERQRVSELIADIPRAVTVILIEHDMSVVLGLADEVTVVHRGKVMLDGTPGGIQGNAEVRAVYLGL